MLRSGAHTVPALRTGFPIPLPFLFYGRVLACVVMWVGDLWDGSNPYLIKNLKAVGLMEKSGGGNARLVSNLFSGTYQYYQSRIVGHTSHVLLHEMG